MHGAFLPVDAIGEVLAKGELGMGGKVIGFVFAVVFVGAILGLGCLGGGHDGGSSGRGIAIIADPGNAESDFDIVGARVSADSDWLEFAMIVRGDLGATTPAVTGELAGSEVYAYVWPTSMAPADVGFEPADGILAFVVTSHPDFDDTPLFDENADGDPANDGREWHSHWVVLVEDAACGADGLKVMDIPEGAEPAMPGTWPGLPLMLDSPGYVPEIGDEDIRIRVPADKLGDVSGAAYDGVTSALQINTDVRAPLLCVSYVFDVASGDLSLPGRVD